MGMTRRTVLGLAISGFFAKASMNNRFNVLQEPNSSAIGSESGIKVLSTWPFGIDANAKAIDIMSKGGSALDAVEQGVRITEADPNVTSVGYNGSLDRDGHLTLDACIMDHRGMCGSVACIEHIKHPISVARAVMEKTPHVMLVGTGALEFAESQGFTRENIITEDALKRWKEWKYSKAAPPPTPENHDTIGLLALDSHGNLSGACTTSGLSYKLPGRVGDSPLIGPGLYVDNEVGGATATGVGESIIRVVGSFLIVELMRSGMEPEAACKEAVKRIVKVHPETYSSLQVGFIALRKDGKTGAFGMRKNEFSYSLTDAMNPNGIVINAPAWLD
jgi:N4-(beta-N-acetylglucosaminyl)-L-asparaginase